MSKSIFDFCWICDKYLFGLDLLKQSEYFIFGLKKIKHIEFYICLIQIRRIPVYNTQFLLSMITFTSTFSLSFLLYFFSQTGWAISLFIIDIFSVRHKSLYFLRLEVICYFINVTFVTSDNFGTLLFTTTFKMSLQVSFFIRLITLTLWTYK